MGIYLHPMSQNPATLEALAGVPSGTYQRLLEVNARHSQDNHKRHSLVEWSPYMTEIDADRDLNALSYLEKCGWGHIDRLTLDIATEGGEPEYGGQATDPDLVQRILDAHGVNLRGVPLEDINGVGWG